MEFYSGRILSSTRFFSNGPSIPDELLNARDEGRVVFVCGAGVSQAFAGLPNFAQLTHRVIETLGVTSQDPARKLLDAAEALEKITGKAGLITADRIFGLLEGEGGFSVQDVEQAVAAALKPTVAPDLAAHRIMLDLAKLPDDRVRIVTTNFDLLFEACDQALPIYRPPRLPDPLRDEDFQGIIHLHGHVDSKYQDSDGDGFVLSSAGFGRAYLAEGWATAFFRSIIEQYIVCFVGYAAEDPPVHYLLEALNSYKKSFVGVYAFQAGNASDADANWKQKGVRSIAYDKADNHKSLWETLASWAERARNPNVWFEKIIAMSQKGPESFLPHERGQAAHIVSTIDGAKRFADAVQPPPAEWLCVFDPTIRYLTPGKLNIYSEDGKYFDPFYDAYGLDEDTPPPRLDSRDTFARRELSFGEWDAFAFNKTDIKNLQEDHYASMRGKRAINVPRLPARLEKLCIWISRVCHQPAAAWWAAGYNEMHHSLQDLIDSQLVKCDKDTCPFEIYKAWRLILEIWKTPQQDADLELYKLKTSIDRDGWTLAAVKKIALIRRPRLTIDDRPRWNGPKPPSWDKNVRCDQLASVSVKYPTPNIQAVIPDEFLLDAVREFRRNLEQAIHLEREISEYGLDHLVPIEPDLSAKGNAYERTYGISSLMLYYVDLFKRLLEKNPQGAKQEYLAWWSDDETVFDLLRIWIAGISSIFNGKEAGELLLKLSRQSFWKRRYQRDLLLVLEKRWHDFPMRTKKQLERRLMQGPLAWESEDEKEFIDRRASTILSWLHRLAEHGCQFSFDLSKVSEKLRKRAPDWQPQYALAAANSQEGRGGSMERVTEYSSLLKESPETLLQKAKELSGEDFDGLKEKDPFTGLSTDRPDLAFAALVSNARRNDYPEWAWRKFLRAEARKNDPVDLSVQIGNNILKLSDDVLNMIVSYTSDWLLSVSNNLLAQQQELFWQIWERLVDVISSNAQSTPSRIVHRKNAPDFVSEGLNGMVGSLAQALMKDPAINRLGRKKSLPLLWKKRAEKLLHLKGDLHRHVLVMFIYNLSWFNTKDPHWTKINLISLLNSDEDDQKAFWSGFFWNPRVNPKLFKLLKPYIVALVYEESMGKQGRLNTLAAILFAHWLQVDLKMNERLITNTEMREILLQAEDNFRVQIIWQIRNWYSGKKEDMDNLSTFFTKVWPKHKKAKSTRATIALCDLMFKNVETFKSLVGIIVPSLSKIDRQSWSMYELSKSKILDLYPDEILNVLDTVLTDNVSEWPYGIENILQRICEVNQALLKDKRMIKLKNKLRSQQ